MPKNAPLETVMFVPVRGEMRASGRITRVPITVPITVEATALQKSRPS